MPAMKTRVNLKKGKLLNIDSLGFTRFKIKPLINQKPEILQLLYEQPLSRDEIAQFENEAILEV
jgi:hypothetical protein